MFEIISSPFIIFFVVAFLFLRIFFARSVYLVRQSEAIIIERLGGFYRVLTPGLHIVVPFVDNARQVSWSYVGISKKHYYSYVRTLTRIDMRESMYDFPKQNVITKDNVMMEVNALLYYQITDPKAAVYEIDNLPQAIEKLTQTKLRDVIGNLDLDESLASRNRINEELRQTLDEATDKWGVKVNRVELQEIKPPEDIRVAMEKQMRAERDKRAAILDAEGEKRAAILQAEGVREGQVLRAKGEAEARVLQSEAESRAIAAIRDAAPEGDPLSYLIALNYMKTLPELAKDKNDKLVIVPYEASALTGSLASMKKIFQEVK